jgi:hypothetical protein
VKLLAAKNHIGNQLQLAEELTPALLQERLAKAVRPAVILDVEGAELELLDFQRCPDLRKAFVLLENHDVASGSTLPEMRRRFEATHTAEEIPIVPRDVKDLPPGLRRLAGLGFREGLLPLLDEGRYAAPPWLKLKPK